VSKITKLCLNLSKFGLQHSRRLFSDTV